MREKMARAKQLYTELLSEEVKNKKNVEKEVSSDEESDILSDEESIETVESVEIEDIQK